MAAPARPGAAAGRGGRSGSGSRPAGGTRRPPGPRRGGLQLWSQGSPYVDGARVPVTVVRDVLVPAPATELSPRVRVHALDVLGAVEGRVALAGHACGHLDEAHDAAHSV